MVLYAAGCACEYGCALECGPHINSSKDRTAVVSTNLRTTSSYKSGPQPITLTADSSSRCKFGPPAWYLEIRRQWLALKPSGTRLVISPRKSLQRGKLHEKCEHDARRGLFLFQMLCLWFCKVKMISIVGYSCHVIWKSNIKTSQIKSRQKHITSSSWVGITCASTIRERKTG